MYKVYVMWRDRDNVIGYHQIDATRFQNDFGLALAIYHSDELSDDGKRKWWYVIEEHSGLAIARGHTGKEAGANAIERIRSHGVDDLNARVTEMVEKYGGSPAYRATYL